MKYAYVFLRGKITITRKRIPLRNPRFLMTEKRYSNIRKFEPNIRYMHILTASNNVSFKSDNSSIEHYVDKQIHRYFVYLTLGGIYEGANCAV